MPDCQGKTCTQCFHELTNQPAKYDPLTFGHRLFFVRPPKFVIPMLKPEECIREKMIKKISEEGAYVFNTNTKSLSF